MQNGDYPSNAEDPDLSKLNLYLVHPDEIDLCYSLMGPNLWPTLFRTKVYDHLLLLNDGQRRAATGLNDDGSVSVFVNQGNSVALLHELGHAMHLAMIAGSQDWPFWKAEAFAMLAQARGIHYGAALAPEWLMRFEDSRDAYLVEGFKEHVDGWSLAWQAVQLRTSLPKQREFIINAQSAEGDQIPPPDKTGP